MRPWSYALVLALLAPAPAFAEGYEVEQSSKPAYPLAVEVNGGIGGWTGSAGRATSLAPSYGAMLIYAPMNQLSVEAGYLGFTAPVDGGGRLSANKVVADVKVGPQLDAPVAWQPYITLGVGANFVSANANDQGLQSSTQTLVPFGVGADFFTRSSVRVGVRGSYDFNPSIGGRVSPTDAHPDSWQAGLLAQGAF